MFVLPCSLLHPKRESWKVTTCGTRRYLLQNMLVTKNSDWLKRNGCSAVKTPWHACQRASSSGRNNTDTSTKSINTTIDRLFLTRQQLNSCRKHLHLTYHSTLEEIGVVEYGNTDEEVSIKLTIDNHNGDYSVKSTVNTQLLCECDRCLEKFMLPVEGYFQLWLSATPPYDEQVMNNNNSRVDNAVEDNIEYLGIDDLEIEVWEPYTSDVQEVSLYSHVYDSVQLALPSKILCNENCPGLPIEAYQKNVTVRASESSIRPLQKVKTEVPEKESKVVEEHISAKWEDIENFVSFSGIEAQDDWCAFK
eukprot:jgi/Galph1/3738/GphlegSOOS_G2419.1